jgi:tetratricopeptide (TPR) repeat protein
MTQSKTKYLKLLALSLPLFFTACKTSKEPVTAIKTTLTESKRLEFDKLFYDANREKIIGNADDAMKLLQRCLVIWPDNAAANYEMAMYIVQKNDVASSVPYAKKAYDIDPKNTYYANLYAELLKASKQFEKAAKVYEKVVAENPSHTEAYLSWANILLTKPDYEKAIKVLDALELQTGISEEISVKKEQIYVRLNKFNKAKEEIDKLINSDPGKGKYYTILGTLYKANNKNDEALAQFEKAVKLDPTDITTHFELADFYRSTGDKAKYFAEVHSLFTNPEIDVDNKVAWILTYFNLDKKDTLSQLNVSKLAEEIVETHPKEAKAHAVHGDFLFRDKLYKEAREAYLKAVSFDKSKYLIWNQLLVIDSELNDWNNMSTDAEKTIELFPNEPVPYLLNGIAKVQNKQIKEAISTFSKGIEYVVDNKSLKGQFLANLGDAYNQDKNNSKSDSCYERALELNPNDVYVLNNYSYYLSMRNEKLDKAEAMSKKSNELEQGNPSYLDTYAWILYVEKKYSDAKKYMEMALEKDEYKNPVLLEHYGDILYKLDMKDNAIDFWNKAKNAGKGSDFLEQKILEKRLIE